MPATTDWKRQIWTDKRWRLTAGLLLAAGLLGWWFRPTGKGGSDSVTFAVRRGPLDITVIEGGNIQALESQEIKCEVRGSYQGVKILKIVDEGYQVTEDDVRTNKVLVELDSSEIQKQVIQQEIQYQSAAASLTEAQQGYEIQVNQNLSDIKAAEQKARFGRMDFDKFMGEAAADGLLQELGLANIIEALTNVVAVVTSPRPEPSPTNAAAAIVAAAGAELPSGSELETGTRVRLAAPGGAAPAGAESEAPTGPTGALAAIAAARQREQAAEEDKGPPTPSLPPALLQSLAIDFSRYADLERLGDGEAKQKVRKFEDDLMVARRELEQARANQESTRRLLEKGYETRINMERDDLALTNNLLKVQTAATAQELFLKYEFPKLAEESLSKYLEGVRELDRSRKAAVSKLAQADARLKSAQAQFNVQMQQRKELYDQLEKCLIRAKKPGLVVYGGGEEVYWRGEEQIREGATVREMQSIITIPDMTKMSVKVRIHESYIKKVKKNQKARVTVDAFPDQPLEGEVTYVGVLPDSQNRWMNPDMKVYRTTIAVNGTFDWLKPGMSAKVEVQVDHLPDVLYVPVQAVVPVEGKQICYVAKGSGADPHPVEVGQFNDSFIEVKSGLKEGELVYLRRPGGSERKDAQPPAGKPKEELAPKSPAGSAPAVAVKA